MKRSDIFMVYDSYSKTLPEFGKPGYLMPINDVLRMMDCVEKNSRVREWGSGISTLALALCEPLSLEVIELDPKWRDFVRSTFRSFGMSTWDKLIWNTLDRTVTNADMALVDNGPTFHHRQLALADEIRLGTKTIIVDDVTHLQISEMAFTEKWDRAALIKQ